MPEDLEGVLLIHEQSLLHLAVRRDPEAAGSLLAEDFREFGSSGRVFDRRAILDLLASEPASDRPVATLSEFTATRVGADAALVTYRATGLGRSTLRSSLWVFRDGRWLLLFHQGTVAGG